MTLFPYATFVVTSYALVAVVLVVLIVSIMIDHRRIKGRLHDLKPCGVSRRSARGDHSA